MSYRENQYGTSELLTIQNNQRFIWKTGIMYPAYKIILGKKNVARRKAESKFVHMNPNVRKKPCIVRKVKYVCAISLLKLSPCSQMEFTYEEVVGKESARRTLEA